MFFLILGALILFAILFYVWMFTTAKRRKEIADHLDYHAAFSSKQPKGLFLTYLIYFGAVLLLFFLLIFGVSQILRDSWERQLLTGGLWMVCVIIGLFGIAKLLGVINKKIEVDTTHVTITDGLGRTHKLTSQDIDKVYFHNPRHSSHDTSARRRQRRKKGGQLYCYLQIAYLDHGGKRHKFKMNMQEKPYMQMVRWTEQHQHEFGK